MSKKRKKTTAILKWDARTKKAQRGWEITQREARATKKAPKRNRMGKVSTELTEALEEAKIV